MHAEAPHTRNGAHTPALRACPCCGLIHQAPALVARQVLRCTRCRSIIVRADRHRRTSRTAALAAAALILYPVGIWLPVLRVERLGHAHEASIVSGSVTLLAGGHLIIGLVVVICSLILPLAKLMALLLLCSRVVPLSARGRARTYHAIELTGRFGMVDVLLVAALVALVKLGDLVSIHAGPGAIAFTAMVLLSLLASASFDPHSLWEEPRP